MLMVELSETSGDPCDWLQYYLYVNWISQAGASMNDFISLFKLKSINTSDDPQLWFTHLTSLTFFETPLIVQTQNCYCNT